MTLGILSLIISGLIIWFWEPVWWLEIVVLGVMSLGLWAIVKTITKKNKIALIIALGMVGMLVLRRFEILDWLTGILLVTVLLLISLIN